jgi:transposase
MRVVYPRCCGVDVHKDSITACVLLFDEEGGCQVRKKEFATHKPALAHFRTWLGLLKVTHVAMESTGVYWIPVWRALEESRLQLILANPRQVKSIPSEKSDPRDSRWIAELLAHGLVRPSFVPPREIRELRDLTRHRVKLTQEYNRIHNRIHKVLEDACIKLDTVASDILGASGRAIIAGVIDGLSVGWLVDRAKGSLRKKRNQLRLAVRGRITEHHRWLLRELMQEVQFVEGQMLAVDQELEERMKPYQELIQRLCAIPGVGVYTAWTLIAELGVDRKAFPDASHAASWAGLCPGNCQSAGKRLSTRTRKGNRWLRRALCQAAWAAIHKKDCYLAASFFRHAARHGQKKAIVATAHRLLVIAYHLMVEKTEYRELGGDYFDRLHPERTRNRLVRRLERMGLDVSLQPRQPEGSLDATALKSSG